jgi:hypothetical protein
MKLSSGIAYAVGLTHEIYAETSTAKWFFMLFRVAELFNRIKERVSDEATQAVVLVCFQIIAKEYQEPLLTTESLWTHAVKRMEMRLDLVKTEEELEKLRLRILEAVDNVIVPVDGAGDFPVQGTVCHIRFNGPLRFAVETAWAIDGGGTSPPRMIQGEVVVSTNRCVPIFVLHE